VVSGEWCPVGVHQSFSEDSEKQRGGSRVATIVGILSLPNTILELHTIVKGWAR
jgi:hypothetical protein